MEVKGLTYVELNMPLTGEIKILSPKNDMPKSFIKRAKGPLARKTLIWYFLKDIYEGYNLDG